MSFMGRQSRLLKTLQFCTRSHLVGDSCSNKGGHKVSSNLAKPLHHTNCCRICAYVNSPFGTTTSKADMFLVARAGMSTQECVDRLIPMIIDAVMPLDQAEQEEFSGIPTTVSGPLFKVKAFPVSLPITTCFLSTRTQQLNAAARQKETRLDPLAQAWGSLGTSF